MAVGSGAATTSGKNTSEVQQSAGSTERTSTQSDSVKVPSSIADDILRNDVQESPIVGIVQSEEWLHNINESVRHWHNSTKGVLKKAVVALELNKSRSIENHINNSLEPKNKTSWLSMIPHTAIWLCAAGGVTLVIGVVLLFRHRLWQASLTKLRFSSLCPFMRPSARDQSSPNNSDNLMRMNDDCDVTIAGPLSGCRVGASMKNDIPPPETLDAVYFDF